MQRAIKHIAAGLHDDAVFTGDTPQRHDVVHRDTLLGETFHNGACAKGSSGNQPAKERRGIGCKIQVGDHPFQALVRVRRTAAVEPVEDNRQVFQRWVLRPGLCQSWLKVVDIEALYARAISLTGTPKPIEFTDRIVGVIRYRDGSVIDVVRQVKENI